MMIVKTPRSALASMIDGLLTALAWATFACLFASGIRSTMADPAHAAAGWALFRLLPDAQSLLAYTLVAACFGLLLAAWACYNAVRFSGRHRRKPLENLPAARLADHFGISLVQLHVLRTSRLILIHHTDEGRISLIDFVHEPACVNDSIQMQR